MANMRCRKRISMLFDGEIFVCFILSSLSLSLLKMYIYIYIQNRIEGSESGHEDGSVQPNNGSMIKMLTLTMHTKFLYRYMLAGGWTTTQCTCVWVSCAYPHHLANYYFFFLSSSAVLQYVSIYDYSSQCIYILVVKLTHTLVTRRCWAPWDKKGAHTHMTFLP